MPYPAGLQPVRALKNMTRILQGSRMLKRAYFEALFWLILSIFVALKAIQLGLGDFTSPGPGLMPLGAAFVMLVLSVLRCMSAYRYQEESRQERNLRMSSVVVVLLIIGYVVMFKPLGYILSGFIFWPLVIKLMGTKRWLWAVAWGIVMTWASYAFFGMVLGLSLPAGELARALWIDDPLKEFNTRITAAAAVELPEMRIAHSMQLRLGGTRHAIASRPRELSVKVALRVIPDRILRNTGRPPFLYLLDIVLQV